MMGKECQWRGRKSGQSFGEDIGGAYIGWILWLCRVIISVGLVYLIIMKRLQMMIQPWIRNLKNGGMKHWRDAVYKAAMTKYITHPKDLENPNVSFLKVTTSPSSSAYGILSRTNVNQMTDSASTGHQSLCLFARYTFLCQCLLWKKRSRFGMVAMKTLLPQWRATLVQCIRLRGVPMGGIL